MENGRFSLRMTTKRAKAKAKNYRAKGRSSGADGAQAGELFGVEGVDFEVYADDLSAAVVVMAFCALAEFGEAEMRELAEFESDRDEDGVDIDAVHAFELEEHIDGAVVVSSTAEDPSAAGKDSAREGVDERIGVAHGCGLRVEGPGKALPRKDRLDGWRNHYHYHRRIGRRPSGVCESATLAAGVRRWDRGEGAKFEEN